MKNKKIVSKLLIASLLSAAILPVVPSHAMTGNVKEHAEGQYIVLMNDERSYEEVKEEYRNDIDVTTDENGVLKEENMLVVSISEEEAGKLEQEEGVIAVGGYYFKNKCG